MQRLFISVCVLLIAGCTTVPQEKIITKTELKYKSIVVLPFVDGTEDVRSTAFKYFYDDLNAANDIKIIAKERANEDLLKEMGVDPQKYAVIDFSVSQEGQKHRNVMKEKLSADGLVLASCYKQNNTLAMYVQMLDVVDGELTLSFSKTEDITNNQEEALKKLAQKSADKVIEHIKDNIVITRIHKY